MIGYDTIYCNYVLNVLREEDESAVLLKIRDLLYYLTMRTAYISVRRDLKKDGLQTSRGFKRRVLLDLPIVFNKSGALYAYTRCKEVSF